MCCNNAGDPDFFSINATTEGSFFSFIPFFYYLFRPSLSLLQYNVPMVIASQLAPYLSLMPLKSILESTNATPQIRAQLP